MADLSESPDRMRHAGMGARRPRWREDFPVRWDEDNYMTRRELAKFLTLGSALLAGVNALIAIRHPRIHASSSAISQDASMRSHRCAHICPALWCISRTIGPWRARVTKDCSRRSTAVRWRARRPGDYRAS